MKLPLLICLITLLLSCKADGPVQSKLSSPPKKELTTSAEKRIYLEEILAKDQGMRTSNESSDIMIKYGQNSKESLAYAQAFMAKDQVLLEQVEWYLDKYGYPTKAELGDDAALTPWLVIHHCTDIGIRNSHFETLQQAYADGNINDDAFTMYLGRTYDFQFGERLEMESPYTIDDEIEKLILELELGQD